MPGRADELGHQPARITKADADWFDALAALLDQQIVLYSELDALGAEQSRHVAGGETEQLLSVLARRQGVVERLTRLSGELEPYAERWDTLLPTLEAARREQLRERTDRIDELVRTIAERDEADRRTLESNRDTASGELNRVNTQRSAHSAYASAAQPASTSPRYQNRQG